MDALGRVGFWIDNTPYKLCTIFVGRSDGSLYVGSNFGNEYADRGLSPAKISYHPDGNTWVTSDLQESVVGREFINTANSASTKNLTIGNGRVYAKGKKYIQHPSFDDIEKDRLVVRFSNGITFYNIHGSDDYSSEFVIESKTKKLSATNMVQGRNFFGINMRFYLAEKSRHLELEDVFNSKPECEWFKYDLPGRNFSFYTSLTNTTETPRGDS